MDDRKIPGRATEPINVWPEGVDDLRLVDPLVDTWIMPVENGRQAKIGPVVRAERVMLLRLRGASYTPSASRRHHPKY